MENNKLFNFKRFQINCNEENNYKKIVEDIFFNSLKKQIKNNCKPNKKAAF